MSEISNLFLAAQELYHNDKGIILNEIFLLHFLLSVLKLSLSLITICSLLILLQHVSLLYGVGVVG